MADYTYYEEPTTPEARRPQHSGRNPQKKLSGVRLARKREIDREAQRSSRVKTKNLIAHLESRIDDLTKVNNSGNVKRLIDQLEEQRKENEELRSTLQAIGKLVGGKGSDLILKSPSPTLEEDNETPDTLQVNPSHIIPGNIAFEEHASHDDNKMVAVAYGETPALQPMYSGFADICSVMPTSQALDTSMISPMSNEPLRNRSPIFNISQSIYQGTSIAGQPRVTVPLKECNCCDSIRFTNAVLESCSKMQLQSNSDQRAKDSDIAIRAVLYGWEVVAQKYFPMDPIWNVLRHVDETVFNTCGKTDRLAVLRLMILMLRYRADHSEQNLQALPSFLRELPIQRLVPHTSLVDFLVWPALRERLILYPHNFCSENFFSMFWNNFRFIWMQSIQSAYTPNYSTGLYQFSPLFIEQTFDLQHWRMTAEFLDEFPQLKEDIPSIEEYTEPEDAFEFEAVTDDFAHNIPMTAPATTFFESPIGQPDFLGEHGFRSHNKV